MMVVISAMMWIVAGVAAVGALGAVSGLELQGKGFLYYNVFPSLLHRSPSLLTFGGGDGGLLEPRTGPGAGPRLSIIICGGGLRRRIGGISEGCGDRRLMSRGGGERGRWRCGGISARGGTRSLSLGTRPLWFWLVSGLESLFKYIFLNPEWCHREGSFSSMSSNFLSQ